MDLSCRICPHAMRHMARFSDLWKTSKIDFLGDSCDPKDPQSSYRINVTDLYELYWSNFVPNLLMMMMISNSKREKGVKDTGCYDVLNKGPPAHHLPKSEFIYFWCYYPPRKSGPWSLVLTLDKANDGKINKNWNHMLPNNCRKMERNVVIAMSHCNNTMAFSK